MEVPEVAEAVGISVELSDRTKPNSVKPQSKGVFSLFCSRELDASEQSRNMEQSKHWAAAVTYTKEGQGGYVVEEYFLDICICREPHRLLKKRKRLQQNIIHSW